MSYTSDNRKRYEMLECRIDRERIYWIESNNFNGKYFEHYSAKLEMELKAQNIEYSIPYSLIYVDESCII